MNKTMKKGEALAKVTGGALVAALRSGLDLTDILEAASEFDAQAVAEMTTEARTLLGGINTNTAAPAQTVGQAIANAVNGGQTWREVLESVRSADSEVYARLRSSVGVDPVSAIR